MLELSKINEIYEARAERKRQEAIAIENREEYIKAANAIFASDNGKFVLKHIIKYCEIFSVAAVLNPTKMVEDQGKRRVYLEMIRPFLDKELLMEIEN